MARNEQAASGLARWAANASARLNWLIERICVALLVLLVLDVWLGVLVRYVIPLPLTFMEEAARYLMIWAALLAVTCGIARREHIGVELLFEKFPRGVQKWLAVAFDLIILGFFLFLLIYGIGFVERGLSRFTMIYGMTKALPFAAVPTAAFIACVQTILVTLRDFAVAEPPHTPDRAEI